MNKNDKNLIERYFNGQVNSEDLIKINRLILEDKDFSRRFEIRKALKEAAELEDNFQYSNQLDNLLKKHHIEVEKERKAKELEILKRKRKLWVSMGGAIAVAILIIGGIYYSIIQNEVKDFALNVDYSEVNYTGGTGFNENGDSTDTTFIRKLNIKFLADKNQKDTIYQNINDDSIKIIFPKLTDELKQAKVSVLHDYKLKSTLFLVNKDTFLMKKSFKPKKLLKYKK